MEQHKCPAGGHFGGGKRGVGRESHMELSQHDSFDLRLGFAARADLGEGGDIGADTRRTGLGPKEDGAY